MAVFERKKSSFDNANVNGTMSDDEVVALYVLVFFSSGRENFVATWLNMP